MAEATEEQRVFRVPQENGDVYVYNVSDLSEAAVGLFNKITIVQQNRLNQEMSWRFENEQKQIVEGAYTQQILPMLPPKPSSIEKTEIVDQVEDAEIVEDGEEVEQNSDKDGD